MSTLEQPKQATRLLTDLQVAALLHISIQTIRRWRLTGQGPRYRKLGSAVRYAESDVMAWIESRPSGGAAA
jgi:predicted DNA-binding transcriptional regulator AlpA